MRSRNPHWSTEDFHGRLATLAEVHPGSTVLDLGCGRGNTLPSLLAQAGDGGEVIAADRDERSLAALRALYPRHVAEGRLRPMRLDLARPLPFASTSIDAVICQNVIECVGDRGALLCEIHRVLNPGGSALIGHHDFDGVMIASDDRDLTRRLVHGYADHTQAWQDRSDGQMGRLLPGLVAQSPFDQCETETVLFVDLDPTRQSYAKIHLDGIVALAEAFGVAAIEARAWRERLLARATTGVFFYALPWTYVLARRASGLESRVP